MTLVPHCTNVIQMFCVYWDVTSGFLTGAALQVRQEPDARRGPGLGPATRAVEAAEAAAPQAVLQPGRERPHLLHGPRPVVGEVTGHLPPEVARGIARIASRSQFRRARHHRRGQEDARRAQIHHDVGLAEGSTLPDTSTSFSSHLEQGILALRLELLKWIPTARCHEWILNVFWCYRSVILF